MVSSLWGNQDVCVVVRAKPFFGHLGQERISQNKDALLLAGYVSMKAMGDRESDAGGLTFGSATV
ncbi:MAG: hypothetical protein JSS38_10675 [Nitrospira sp.]|nr:hypothetical protein [Nitrospira sp.]